MHRKPTIRDRYGATAAVLVAVVMIVVAALFGSASSSSAAPTTVGGHAAQLLAAPSPIKALTSDSDYCNLSANWRVNGSATWYGNGLSYTVLSSPGALIIGGEIASYSIASGSATSNRWASYYKTSAPGATPYVYRSDHYGYNTSKVTIQVYGGNSACYMELYR
jgi:hypothetical protein